MVKEMIPEKELKIVQEEIVILSEMEHPHIINYIESYEDDRYLFIIMEYAEEAIELKALIDEQHRHMTKDEPLLTEKDIAPYIHMLVLGVMHIHNNNVVHRDLKLWLIKNK